MILANDPHMPVASAEFAGYGLGVLVQPHIQLVHSLLLFRKPSPLDPGLQRVELLPQRLLTLELFEIGVFESFAFPVAGRRSF